MRLLLVELVEQMRGEHDARDAAEEHWRVRTDSCAESDPDVPSLLVAGRKHATSPMVNAIVNGRAMKIPWMIARNIVRSAASCRPSAADGAGSSSARWTVTSASATAPSSHVARDA